MAAQETCQQTDFPGWILHSWPRVYLYRYVVRRHWENLHGTGVITKKQLWKCISKDSSWEITQWRESMEHNLQVVHLGGISHILHIRLPKHHWNIQLSFNPVWWSLFIDIWRCLDLHGKKISSPMRNSRPLSPQFSITSWVGIIIPILKMRKPS